MTLNEGSSNGLSDFEKDCFVLKNVSSQWKKEL